MSTKFHFLKSYVKVSNGCVYPRCYVKWDKTKKCFTLFGELCKIVDEGTFEEIGGTHNDEVRNAKLKLNRMYGCEAFAPSKPPKFTNDIGLRRRLGMHTFVVVFKHQGLEVSIFAFSRKELAEQYCKELTEDLKPWSRIHFFVKEVK